MDEIKFCDFTEKDQTQICTIASKLISVTHDDIKGYYRIFKESFNDIKEEQYDENKYIPIPINKVILYDEEEKWFNTGIDLPICFSTSKSNKTILIIAQDPLRNEKYFKCLNCDNNYEEAIIGTPFSLHNNFYRKYLFKELYSLIQSIVKEMEARVYISDIFKIYFVAKNKQSINNQKFTTNKNHKDILEEEISFFTPDLIISFGEKATQSLFKIYNIQNKISITSEVKPQHIKDNLLLLPMLHPSGQGQIHRKNFFHNNNIDKYVSMNEGYIRIINDKIYSK